MARPCDTCLNYSKRIDEFRQQWNDIIKIGVKAPAPHYCPMYDSRIPDKVYYDGHDCDYYVKQEDEN